MWGLRSAACRICLQTVLHAHSTGTLCICAGRAHLLLHNLDHVLVLQLVAEPAPAAPSMMGRQLIVEAQRTARRQDHPFGKPTSSLYALSLLSVKKCRGGVWRRGLRVGLKLGARAAAGSAWTRCPTRARTGSPRPASCGSGRTATPPWCHRGPLTARPGRQSRACRPPAPRAARSTVGVALGRGKCHRVHAVPRRTLLTCESRQLTCARMRACPQCSPEQGRSASCCLSSIGWGPYAASTPSSPNPIPGPPRGAAPAWCTRARAPWTPTCAPAGRPCSGSGTRCTAASRACAQWRPPAQRAGLLGSLVACTSTGRCSAFPQHEARAQAKLTIGMLRRRGCIVLHLHNMVNLHNMVDLPCCNNLCNPHVLHNQYI